MSDLKSAGVALNLGGVETRMLFTLNVMEKCVDRYGNLDDLLQNLNKGLAEVKWVALQMLNEGIETWNDEHPDDRRPLMEEQRLGRLVLGVSGINELSGKVREAIFAGLPKDAVEVVEESAKNLLATRETTKPPRKMKRIS